MNWLRMVMIRLAAVLEARRGDPRLIEMLRTYEPQPADGGGLMALTPAGTQNGVTTFVYHGQWQTIKDVMPFIDMSSTDRILFVFDVGSFEVKHRSAEEPYLEIPEHFTRLGG